MPDLLEACTADEPPLLELDELVSADAVGLDALLRIEATRGASWWRCQNTSGSSSTCWQANAAVTAAGARRVRRRCRRRVPTERAAFFYSRPGCWRDEPRRDVPEEGTGDGHGAGKARGVRSSAALAAACGEAPVARRSPPPEVYVRPSSRRTCPIYLELVGQTAGFQDVEIRARVEGFLETVNFREGSFVRQGAPALRDRSEAARGDPRGGQGRPGDRRGAAREGQQRRRALHAARGEAGGQPAGARRRAGRRRTRRARRSRRAQGRASRRRRSISATRASPSPINGLVGTTQVKPGNLVGRGESTLLTTISQIDPMLFRVGVTEADYLRVAQARSDAHRRRRRAADGIQLTLADGTRLPAHGPRRPGRARRRSRRPAPWACSSCFPIPEQLLRPGQYGRARLLLDTKAGRAARPAARRAGTAEPLQRRRGRRRQQGGVPQREGRPARRLAVGDRGGPQARRAVVVEGLQRIQDGMTVVAEAGAGAPRADRARRRQPAGEAK